MGSSEDTENRGRRYRRELQESGLPAWHRIQNAGTDGAADWAVGLSIASQLPGRLDGPADAFRHLLIAGELHRVYGERYAHVLLWAHELDGEIFSDRSMDEYNNLIGREIGRYVRANDGTTADVIKFAKQIMLNSFPGGAGDSVSWEPGPDSGWQVKGARTTQLPNGVVLQPVVVAEIDPGKWLSSNPRDNNTNELLPTGSVNWPADGWENQFDYTGADKASQYLLRNRPTQWTESAEPSRPGPGTRPGARPGNPHGPESRKRDRGDLRDAAPHEQPDPDGFMSGRGDLFKPMTGQRVEPDVPDPEHGSLPGTAPNGYSGFASIAELDIPQMAEEVFSSLTLDDWAVIPDDDDPFDGRFPFAEGVKWVPGLGPPPVSP
ncbi:MAG: hypothetical protein ABJM26_05445 [Anderseniella sp.]